MKSEKLLDAIGGIGDDKILEAHAAAEPRGRKSWAGWAALAACVCLVAGAAVWSAARPAPQPGREEPPAATQNVPVVNAPGTDAPEVTPSAHTPMATSDTYHSLSELLAYLSEHDYHDTRAEDGLGSRAVDAETAEAAGGALRYGEYLYLLPDGESSVQIFRADMIEPVGTLGDGVARILLWEDRLVCVSGQGSRHGFEEEAPEQRIDVYSLAAPESPALLDSFTQSGELTEAYLSGSRLILLTSDGVCACGWSRLDDAAAYVPRLAHGGAEIPWTDEAICILGEPVSVEYIAATAIDLASFEVAAQRAFYGNILKAFCGPDWLAFTVSSQTDEMETRPALYAFDTAAGFDFTGKLSTAELFGLEETVALDGGVRPEGDYPAIVSITKAGDEFRMVGSYLTGAGGTRVGSFLAVTKNFAAGLPASYALLDAADYPYASYDEIRWEPDRAILCVDTMYNVFTGDLEEVERFVFADFSGGEIRFFGNDLKADHVSGIDMLYTYGSPLGQFETLIPLENGIYLRYNGRPDGFDIFDFSDSARPLCLYRSDGTLLPEGCRLDFENAVYADGTVGVRVIWPDENGAYRNVTYTWRVYAVDPAAAQPFTLVRETA